jgi:hypothetical protein
MDGRRRNYWVLSEIKGIPAMSDIERGMYLGGGFVIAIFYIWCLL